MSLYSFHNAGSSVNFAPNKKIKAGNDTTTSLEFYKELARSAAKPDVYILDNKGREVK